ncbi:MAG: hypothetical protein QG608_1841 [Actinomycetota bacterium]|nr:hypothetical protein [Actinomycetota bacterium]
MHTGLRHGLGWLCAASLATGLTWVAIRDVLNSTGIGVPDSVSGAPPGGGVALVDPAPVSTTASTDRPTGRRTGPSGSPSPSVPNSRSPSPTVSRRPDGGESAAGPAKTTSPAALPTGSGGGTQQNSPEQNEQTPPASGSTVVRSYSLEGGHVVLEISPDRAELISATPRDGFQVQSWTQTGWLRVEFTSSNDHSSLFATWNGYSPEVKAVEY